MRGWEERDRSEFARMNSHPNVMEFFPSLWPTEESDAVFDKVQALILDRGWGLWAIEEKATGKYVGFTGLSIPSFEAAFLPAVEIGIVDAQGVLTARRRTERALKR